jgi:hypothetical protein
MWKRPVGLYLVALWLFFEGSNSLRPYLVKAEGPEAIANYGFDLTRIGVLVALCLLVVWMVELLRLHPVARWLALAFFAVTAAFRVWQLAWFATSLSAAGLLVLLAMLIFDALALRYLVMPPGTKKWQEARR